MDDIVKQIQAMHEYGRVQSIRNAQEIRRNDFIIKCLFAAMCPPLALFPQFWRD